MLIGLGKGLTFINFVFFMSKVTFVKMVSADFVKNYLSQSFHM